jgi:hypothetical protein
LSNSNVFTIWLRIFNISIGGNANIWK